MTYIRIKIFPCKNTTDNHYHCKSREIIDYHLTSGYFSILIKNFGLNPSNFTVPVLPTLQDIYTTIDKRILRNFIINFGVTEIHTDVSIFNENIEKVKYLQYRDNFQTFQYRENKDYLDGKELCVTQLKLDDTIIIQRRAYTKLSDIFSKVGGYMQLINTVFSLLTLITNRFQTEIKLLNSIFNFNIKEKKMGLKFRSLDQQSKNHLTSNKNLIFSSKKSLKNIEFDNSRSKNNLNYIDNNCSNISSILNVSDNKNTPNDNLSKGVNTKNTLNLKSFDNFKKTFKSNDSLPKININIDSNEIKKCDTILFKEHIKLNLFEILCYTKKSKKLKDIELFKLVNSFYKKRMDIVHVFTLLIITEKVLIKNNENKSLFYIQKSY